MPLDELLKMYRQNAPERPYSSEGDDDSVKNSIEVIDRLFMGS